MLVDWSAAGPLQERELFVTRACLQYLVLGNTRDAQAVHERFLALCAGLGQALPPTPLLNFLRLALAALEREQYELWAMLCEKYSPVIARDEYLVAYTEHLAELHFGKRQLAGDEEARAARREHVALFVGQVAIDN